MTSVRRPERVASFPSGGLAPTPVNTCEKEYA
jgi:hypothetical protein